MYSVSPRTITVLPSAARTATTVSSTLSSGNCRGVTLFVNVTAVVTTPSVTISIEGKCPVSGENYALLVSAAITTTGLTALRIYPGIAAVANLAASAALPASWLVAVTHANSDSITYSIGASLIP